MESFSWKGASCIPRTKTELILGTKDYLLRVSVWVGENVVKALGDHPDEERMLKESYRSDDFDKG